MVDLLISGPEGKIEAKYTHNNNDQSPIVLILHPDPSRGGTMNTKIICRPYCVESLASRPIKSVKKKKRIEVDMYHIK